MSARRRHVKAEAGRAYDASRRRAAAEQRRNGTLDAARAAFLRDGYAATTVDSVAAAAGVSAATIYKTYGGKSGLVRAICEQALAGVGPVSAEDRSNALRMTTGDARVIVAGWGELAAEVSPRISPMVLLLRSASHADADAAALLTEFDRDRLARMAENARFLAKAGHLRPDVSLTEARDVMWMCTAPELYDLLFVRRKWTRKQFARFVTRTITAALLR